MTSTNTQETTYTSRIDGVERDEAYLTMGSAHDIAHLISELAGIYELKTGKAYEWDHTKRFPRVEDLQMWDKEDRVVLWITLFGDVEKEKGHWVHEYNKREQEKMDARMREMFPNHDDLMRKPI